MNEGTLKSSEADRKKDDLLRNRGGMPLLRNLIYPGRCLDFTEANLAFETSALMRILNTYIMLNIWSRETWCMSSIMFAYSVYGYEIVVSFICDGFGIYGIMTWFGEAIDGWLAWACET